MIVVLSGEGPTDLGQCSNAQNTCEDADFQIGPMTVLVNQMLASRLDYSLFSIPGAYRYVSEAALVKRAAARKHDGRKVSFAGKKREQETAYFHINAWALAEIALQIERKHGDTVVAVLFRDCDGTRSSSSGLWASKWKSMVNGFGRANFSRGIPMLPKPKSEAWLLCNAQSSVANCDCFEKLPGNDASPKSAKLMLDEAFGAHKAGNEICEWLDTNPVDEARLSTMPSFLAFQKELDRVIAEVIH